MKIRKLESVMLILDKTFRTRYFLLFFLSFTQILYDKIFSKGLGAVAKIVNYTSALIFPELMPYLTTSLHHIAISVIYTEGIYNLLPKTF